ncbi:uncharacterized protein LOC131166939 isoform X2 [Malania oleifera]|uniref:uncharacterized protein LOC131166939 isoform X2 n=1 Tax=Malania oleifera TaxID=397392 RepID=UPI0025AE7EA1|nr:uncharacterized protein LOC131166939 isoform X2 [Malania oleifera]
MEKRKTRCSKRKRELGYYTDTCLLQGGDYNLAIVFGVLLAALCNLQKQSLFLIQKCLNRLHLSLLSNADPPQSISIPILSLLPILLKSRWSELVTCTAKIIGAASLLSFEMNEQIASDGEIIRGLVSALASSNRRILRAACSAVLDLSATSIGRQALLEFSAVENLMFGYLQVPKSSNTLVFLHAMGKGSDTCPGIGFKDDELPLLLLDAGITLINTCSIMQLEKIPRKLSEAFLVYLKDLWEKVHKQVLRRKILKYKKGTYFYLSTIRTNDLAESIFRLSINEGQFTTHFLCEQVKRSIFGSSEPSFENFMLNHWEVSPYLRRGFSKANDHDDIFSSVLQSLNLGGSFSSSVSSILRSLVSCPPIASDELDICGFLKEVRHKLGCPITYQQDIRVLKTERHLKREVHFFPESSSCGCIKAHVFHTDDILKCEGAYNEGYTIALRGMEFRFKSIATAADGLASLFGQPSVGANLYMTPPNSQGLACHYDDHCVFVCQLLGTKKWRIFSQPAVQLPRLYEPLDNLHGLEVECSTAGSREFLLREGDVLYIPRGFPHEACTVADKIGINGACGFSLHLTLSIEIEPPFELIGDSDPTFRKACLVAGISLQSDDFGWLEQSQKTIFSQLIDSINAKSTFSEALRTVEQAIQKDEDIFQQIRWLELFNQDGEIIDGCGWNFQFMSAENLLSLFDLYKDKTEAVFVEVKSNFCREVMFENTREHYRMLLGKYRKARMQYMSGMLSLHCT